MVKGKFVGFQVRSGHSRKTDKDYSLTIANITSDWSVSDQINGAVGVQVHSVVVPDHLKEELVSGNVGKSGDFDFYFVNGSERLAYARLSAK